MPFLTEVHFQNYRSFLDAKCRLSPVTVVIGANNAGKSNFLRGVGLVVKSTEVFGTISSMENPKGVQHRWGEQWDEETKLTAQTVYGEARLTCNDNTEGPYETPPSRGWQKSYMPSSIRSIIYTLKPESIGGPEAEDSPLGVKTGGEGVVSTLRCLESSSPESLEHLLNDLRVFVPEIESFKFKQVASQEMETQWQLLVREAGCDSSAVLSELSPGTRAILAILTIFYQPNRPELILIEDIEHAIHPRGLKPLVETMRKISKEHGVQIIFTTQSPYVLDAFQDPEHWDSVVIVEKRDGVSTLTNAKERLEALGYEREMDKVPLGDLWYSGIMGGVAEVPEVWQKQ